MDMMDVLSIIAHSNKREVFFMGTFHFVSKTITIKKKGTAIVDYCAILSFFFTPNK